MVLGRKVKLKTMWLREKINGSISKVIEALQRILPIEENSVLFVSFEGQYCDNPRYISEQLHQMTPEINIYWALSNKCHEVIPSYVKPVQYGSPSYIKMEMRAQVVVSNYIGKMHKEKNLLQKWLAKRTEQFTIATWHGTPLKRIGLDDKGSQWKVTVPYILDTDVLISGCRYTASILSTAFQQKPYDISLTGTPRNDLLIHLCENVQNIKEKLHLPKNKKVVLFAPTFKDNVEQSGSDQMKQLNFENLFSALKRVWKGEWIFLFRVHHAVLSAIDTQKYNSQTVMSGNNFDDMAEYLVCADVLITDYSGSMYDFALTGKPCFLFASDREQYEMHERGFYMEYDKLPFPIAYDADQLIDNVNNFDEPKYKRDIKCFLEDIGNIEDGHASERIAASIIHFIKTGEKKLELSPLTAKYVNM